MINDAPTRSIAWFRRRHRFLRQTVLDFTYGYIGLHGLERYYDDLNIRDPFRVDTVGEG